MKNLKNNQIFGLIILALVIGSCSSENQPDIPQAVVAESQVELIPSSEIDQIIWKSLQETGDFIWVNQSDELILSALIQSDSNL